MAPTAYQQKVIAAALAIAAGKERKYEFHYADRDLFIKPQGDALFHHNFGLPNGFGTYLVVPHNAEGIVLGGQPSFRELEALVFIEVELQDEIHAMEHPLEPRPQREYLFPFEDPIYFPPTINNPFV